MKVNNYREVPQRSPEARLDQPTLSSTEHQTPSVIQTGIKPNLL
jgi:hypothetical protein